MPEAAVTIVRCRRCDRTGQLIVEKDRLWCGWCQDWALPSTECVVDALVEHRDHEPRLVRQPPDHYPLQPLRIPSGWTVEYNNGLFEVDPDPDCVRGDVRWFIFKQDMLQMVHARCNRLLDLGWYPEGDLENGQYGLSVHEGDCRGRLLHEFFCRDRTTLVAELERLLKSVSNGEL